MLKAYKYRLYPNAKQIEMFEKHFNYTRFVYNWALNLHKKYDSQFKHREEKFTHLELMVKIAAVLVKKKKKEQFSWLKEVNSQSLLSALQNLSQAYLRYFAKQNGEPKFKAKRWTKPSFQCPQHCKVDFILGKLDLPKMKGVKIKFDRQFNGKIKTVTISKTPTGKYFASILVDDGASLPTPQTPSKNLTLGIDLGITHFITLSNGNKIDNPKYLKKYLGQLKIEDKKLSRKQENSIDSVVTDPPYGMNFVSGRRKEKYKKIKNDNNLNEWLDDFTNEIYRVLKDNTASFVFCSWHNIDIFKQSLEKKFKIKNILVWVKNNHGSGDLKGAFAPKHEFIIHIQKGRKILEGKREPDVLFFNKTGNEFHPTQKPIDLIEYLISKSTKENDTVLDPFLGSGSTAIACINTKRKIIGCELDKDYYDIIQKRLSN